MKFNEDQREKVGDVIRDYDPYYNPILDEYIDRIESILSQPDAEQGNEEGSTPAESEEKSIEDKWPPEQWRRELTKHAFENADIPYSLRQTAKVSFDEDIGSIVLSERDSTPAESGQSDKVVIGHDDYLSNGINYNANTLRNAAKDEGGITRKELISSDEYLLSILEFEIRGDKRIKNMRDEVFTFVKKHRVEYALFIAASETSRLRAELAKAMNDVDIANVGKTHYFKMFQEQIHKSESLQSELSAANQRIAELSERIVQSVLSERIETMQKPIY